MTVLVTGATGFIGMHTTMQLMARGEKVVGIDNLNEYYDVKLKLARRDRLQKNENFVFFKVDIADREGLKKVVEAHPDIDRIVHLAAQAGVRYSLKNPYAYIETNVQGHLNIMELVRHKKGGIKHMVYASSSSVYGGNKKKPSATDDRTENPISLYAATKKSGELMSHTYAHLFDIPMTGIRFFTVYGPWGRPDMAAWIFTECLFKGEAIPVFNNGEMKRDFTYVDDIVRGVVKCLDNPPCREGDKAPVRLYNIGNHRPEKLMDMIAILEKATGRKASYDFKPMQPGDVVESFADIDPMRRDFGYAPTTPISVGMPNFVNWYKAYKGID